MGAGASSIPALVDYQTFQRLSGGTSSEALFYAHADVERNGLRFMSRDKVVELASTRDVYLSYDSGEDSHERNIGELVTRVQAYLQAKGLIVHHDEELNHVFTGSKDLSLTNRIIEGIAKTKCTVCFLTESYIQKVMMTNTETGMDKCAFEFMYTLRSKHPDYVIPVLLDSALLPRISDSARNAALWQGPVELAVGGAPFVDMTPESSSNFDQKCDEIYHKVMRIASNRNKVERDTQIKEQLILGGAASVLSQVDKSREEALFFQWMARATNIDEQRRLLYCNTLVKRGICTLFVLAHMMKTVPGFLIHVGIQEVDADKIACAIRDLGLGFFPVREFEEATTLQSVIFALNKSTKVTDDPQMAESALACVARVAASNPIIPSLLDEAGVGEAVMKLMKMYLNHKGCHINGCIALNTIAKNSVDVCSKLGEKGACNTLAQSLKCHWGTAEVAAQGCETVATFARGHKKNREQFSITGTCELVMQVFKTHPNSAAAVYQCCSATVSLCENHMENMGKMVAGGCCLTSAASLEMHIGDSVTVEPLLHVIEMVAHDSSSRSVYGAETTCIPSLILCLNTLMEHRDIVRYGCLALSALINGNAFNRSEFGKHGACELVTKLLQIYYDQDDEIIAAVCRAVFALIAGNQQHKVYFESAGVLPILQHIMQNPTKPEASKEAYEALRYLHPEMMTSRS